MNVYDFDETIYDGESSVQFVYYYLKYDPSVIKFVPLMIKMMARYNRGLATFDDFSKNYAHIFKDYFAKKSVDLEKLSKDFWDKHEGAIKPFYKKLQREDDVIITASPEFMMRDICDRIGVKNLVATDFDVKTGEVHTPCFRESKIECFRKAFPDGVIDNFYTDSMNDQFLFPFAKHVFMVKGNKIKQIK